MRLREMAFEFIHKQPYGTEDVIDIKEAIIKRDFELTTPKPWKMKRCREATAKKGFIDSPITISIRRNKKYLEDGYTRYLVALELHMERIPVKYINYK